MFDIIFPLRSFDFMQAKFFTPGNNFFVKALCVSVQIFDLILDDFFFPLE